MGEIECTKCIYNINNECKIGGWMIPKVGCQDGKAKPITNADRIRAMTDEELAEWLVEVTEDNTPDWLDWLRQEAADKDGAE